MARSLAEADEMIAAAGDAGAVARRRAHRALQPGGRGGAAAAGRSAVHRGASARHVSRAQPRHRRRLRPDDSRPRRRAVAGPRRGRVDRGGRRAGADGRVDIANARLRFATGCIANLTASRISRDRVRKIRFFQPAAYLSIDYAAQKVERVAAGQGQTARCRRSKAASSTVAERGAAQARARRLRRRGARAARAGGDRRRRPPRAGARAARSPIE